jgi:hypothetical protein
MSDFENNLKQLLSTEADQMNMSETLPGKAKRAIRIRQASVAGSTLMVIAVIATFAIGALELGGDSRYNDVIAPPVVTDESEVLVHAGGTNGFRDWQLQTLPNSEPGPCIRFEVDGQAEECVTFDPGEGDAAYYTGYSPGLETSFVVAFASDPVDDGYVTLTKATSTPLPSQKGLLVGNLDYTLERFRDGSERVSYYVGFLGVLSEPAEVALQSEVDRLGRAFVNLVDAPGGSVEVEPLLPVGYGIEDLHGVTEEFPSSPFGSEFPVLWETKDEVCIFVFGADLCRDATQDGSGVRIMNFTDSPEGPGFAAEVSPDVTAAFYSEAGEREDVGIEVTDPSDKFTRAGRILSYGFETYPEGLLTLLDENGGVIDSYQFTGNNPRD